MEIEGARIVVTGGAGFVGSHVVDRLTAMGASVRVVDDLSVGERANLAAAGQRGAELVIGDICDRETMEWATAGADIVVHAACDNLRASLREPMHTHDVNSTGTLVTALAAVKAEVQRFVYVSSAEAYGSARTSPMNEDHPLLPTTVYGASKASGELYAQGCRRTYGLPATVVRLFNSYGPREHTEGSSAEVIPKFVTRLLAGLPPVIFGDGSQRRDFTWVEETAEGIVAATACDALVGDSVNIAHGSAVSIREIADLLIEIVGRDDLEPEMIDARPGDVQEHWADTSKAKDLLGFDAQVGVHEGLARYVQWVQASGVARSDPEHVQNW